MMRNWIIALLALSAWGCTKKTGYRVEHFEEVKVEELAEDIKLPTKAWDLLEFKSGEAAAHGSGGEGHGEGAAKAASKNFTFAEVNVLLVQKNEGVVEGEAVKIRLPKGGGRIDLSRYITGQPGTFYVGFEYPAFEAATDKKVVFVSRSRKRKIGDKVFGEGCNAILDITPRFLKEMQGEGLKVNTTQERYLSVLGGTFLFSAQNGSDVLLAQVTFVNPQFPHLFCEEK